MGIDRLGFLDCFLKFTCRDRRSDCGLPAIYLSKLLTALQAVTIPTVEWRVTNFYKRGDLHKSSIPTSTYICGKSI